MTVLWRDANLLWLLVAVVALGVFLYAAAGRRRRALAGFAEAKLLGKLVGGTALRRRAAVSTLRCAALAALVVAIAGPRWGFRWEEVHREGIDILIALDTSRSMLAGDVKPNRLERAKLAVMDLVDRLDGDRIGLVAFAGSAFLECPLTLDYAAFERTLRATKVGIIPVGGTALGRAIDTSLEAFEAKQGKHEALILITDGEDHEGDVEAAAARAREAGVKIYTVGIGTSDGELIPLGGEHAAGYVKDRAGQVVKSRLDEQQLQDIALASDGAFVRGVGATLGLDEVFDEHIARMERRDLQSTLERRYERRFQYPIAMALLLLLVEVVVGAGRGRRVGRGLRRLRGGGAGVRAAAVVFAAPLLLGWLGGGERAPLAEGARLYDEGRYEDAITRYREALVDAPDAVALQYNLGAALYRGGEFEQAADAYRKVAARGLDEWTGRASYNLGNALYQLGERTVEADPQATLQTWQEALLAYRRAMAEDYGDADPKFNHELVARALEDLERKLDEEREQQEQEQGDEQQPDPDDQDQQDQQDQQEQDEQDEQDEQPPPEGDEPPDPQDQQDQQDQQEQQEQDSEQQDQRENQPPPESEQDGQDESAGQGEQEPDAEPQPADASDGGAEPEPDDRQSEQAAQAIIDLAQDEELGPEDIERPTGIIGSRNPAKDW